MNSLKNINNNVTEFINYYYYADDCYVSETKHDYVHCSCLAS